MDNLDSATTISSSYSGLDPDTLVFIRLILEQASVTEVTESFFLFSHGQLLPGLQKFGSELRVEILHSAVSRQSWSDEVTGAGYIQHSSRCEDRD